MISGRGAFSDHVNKIYRCVLNPHKRSLFKLRRIDNVFVPKRVQELIMYLYPDIEGRLDSFYTK